MAARQASRAQETAGNEVQLLEGGAELFPALELALAGAREHVFVETYLFNDDAATRRLVTALGAAAARGVRVSLVVDGFGTPLLPPVLATQLSAQGVLVEIFRPEQGLIVPSRGRLRRLHRKLAVVDTEVAFVGGINLIDDLADPGAQLLHAPRLDYAVRVRGPLVAQVLQAAQRLWQEVVGRRKAPRAVPGKEEPVRASPARSPASDATGGVTRAAANGAGRGPVHAVLVLRDNLRFRRDIEREYLRAIGQARREIVIANAYFFPGARFLRALMRAAARGVRVRLLLQGRVEYLLPHFGSQALYDDLLRAGIEIVEYRVSYLHAKVAVIDDWATVGSSNIDPFSLLLAREANVVVRDAAFAAALRKRLVHAIEQGGEPVALERHERRSLPVRMLNWVGYAALRFGIAISGVRGRY